MTPSLGLDHVYLRVHDLDAVLDLFQQRLGLPLTWPVREEPFARYAWVNAGNVQLELWQARSDHDLPAGTPLPCVAGLALWPEDVHASRRALEGAEVACKEPKAWRTAALGGETLNFTNCLVLDASAPTCQVFFCEWGPNAPIVPWPKGESTSDRRARLAKELAEQNGGAVGLVGLRAVHMRSPGRPRPRERGRRSRARPELPRPMWRCAWTLASNFESTQWSSASWTCSQRRLC